MRDECECEVCPSCDTTLLCEECFKLQMASRNSVAEAAAAYRERAEKAERERDEALRKLEVLRLRAVITIPLDGKWAAICPGGRALCGKGPALSERWWGDDGDADHALRWKKPEQALAAGRAAPWWEIQP